MKRFYLFVLCVFASLPVLAKNKISMVTYFPVPYVAYSQVNTTKQLDIGLTSTCDMKLGCSEESATLNAGQVNLKGGKLNLDGGLGISGGTLSLGSGVGEGKISFRNVRIQTGNVESVNAEDMKVSDLNLFGKAFPSCKDANSESNGQMQWASLKLKGASSSELYLACGAVQGSACAESYGAWQAASAGEADTCNGNTSSSFTCTSGVVKTCVDILTDGTDNYVELGEGNNPYDECPGNNDSDKYVCDGSWSGTCIDVYDAGVKGEWLDNGNMIRLSCQNNSLQSTGDGAFCTSAGVRPAQSADEACAELIRTHSVNELYAGESHTCAVLDNSATTQDLCNSLGWNSTHDIIPFWLVCKNMPKQRNVTCGGKKKRTVRCC